MQPPRGMDAPQEIAHTEIVDGSHRRGLGIAGRTAVLLIVLVAILAGGAGWWLVQRDARARRQALVDRATSLAGTLERSLRGAMVGGHRDHIGAVVSAVGGTDGVRALAVADAAGHVRFRAGDAPERLAVGEGRELSWTDATLTLRREISNGPACSKCHDPSERINGLIEVSMDATAARAAQGSASTTAIAALVAISAITALVLVLLLRLTVSRPLRRLRAFAEVLGQGDLHARPPELSGPDTGALADALRSMAERIQGAHDALEERVEARTRDLTEALRESVVAREERSRALAHLQAIVDCMADGVIFIDAEDRIALTNRAACAYRDLEGRTGRSIRECHPSGAHLVLDRVLAYLRHGDDAGPAHSILREQDARFETTYAPVRTGDGTYVGVVMVIRDIAERRTLERRLIDAERLAAVGRMSAQVAHELRNPLNVIAGAVQYLRRAVPESDDVREYGELIEGEVERLNRFVHDLLHVARPAEPVFAPGDVDAVVREAVRRVTLSRGCPEGAVTLDLATGLPALDLDRRLVLEAVVNLVDNALNAGGDAPVEVVTRLESGGGSGRVAVEVLDRGRGIPPDQLDEVRQPFVTTSATGTGLGLTIVSRAMEVHRGAFDLAPRTDGGMAAVLRFPVRRILTEAAIEMRA